MGRDRGLALKRATKPVGAWGKSRRAPLSLLRAMQRDVDLIAYGQFSLQPANRRYATFWQPLSGGCGRSSVVFTEGADSSPPDWGSVPEACEIGGLGTLVAALRGGSSERARRPAVVAAEGRLDRSVTNSGRGKGASPCTRCLVRLPPGTVRVGQLPG